MAVLTEEEVQRRRDSGENIVLLRGESATDLNRYVNTDTGIIVGLPPGEKERLNASLRQALGIDNLRPTQQTRQKVKENLRQSSQELEEALENFKQVSPQKNKQKPKRPAGSGISTDSMVNSLLGSEKNAVVHNNPKKLAQEYSGFNNTKILEPNPYYDASDAEGAQVSSYGLRGKHNTHIILGRDRPRGKDSGKGKEANTHVGCIDIIAGMSGILAREVDSQGNQVVTNKSPELDAARIYISQRADIDSPEYFNLAQGNVGNITNRSAIAIKADSVRIIGREGIKLVTSTDVYSGASGRYIGQEIQGIDLIAGNDDSDLQPMVKGDNLEKVLDSLLELIVDSQASTAFVFELLIAFMGAFIDPTGSAFSRLSTLLTRAPVEVRNMAEQEKNFVKHYLNYKVDKNPYAKYKFKSQHNNVN